LKNDRKNRPNKSDEDGVWKRNSFVSTKRVDDGFACRTRVQIVRETENRMTKNNSPDERRKVPRKYRNGPTALRKYNTVRFYRRTAAVFVTGPTGFER